MYVCIYSECLGGSLGPGRRCSECTRRMQETLQQPARLEQTPARLEQQLQTGSRHLGCSECTRRM